jgi:branched-chain amino acid transport system permease protein
MEKRISVRLVAIIALGTLAALSVLLIPQTSLHAATRIVVFCGAAMSLNLLIGNAGLVSMGHGLFLGLGAYATAVANVKYGMSLGLCIVVALAISIVAGAVAGFIALRARALFFALLTLALGQVFYVFVARNYNLTGGDDGLVGIDVPAWLENEAGQYLFAVAFTLGLCIALLLLLASPFGATLRAVRDNPERVASLGGNPKLYEFAAFVVSGFCASVVGVVIAVTDGSVEPGIASWTTGATLLVMVALGGRFTFLGPIAGVIILETVRTFVQTRSTHADLAVGLIVILCALCFPEGLGQGIELLRLSPRTVRPFRLGAQRVRNSGRQ